MERGSQVAHSTVYRRIFLYNALFRQTQQSFAYDVRMFDASDKKGLVGAKNRAQVAAATQLTQVGQENGTVFGVPYNTPRCAPATRCRAERTIAPYREHSPPRCRSTRSSCREFLVKKYSNAFIFQNIYKT